MIDNKGYLERMKALLEDMETIEHFIRADEQKKADGNDLWIGLGRLADIDAGKEIVLKPLLPRHSVTRRELVAALERHMPKIREEVLNALKEEYNSRLEELSKSKL